MAAAQAASAVLSEKTKRSANAEDASKAAQEAALAALARVKAKQVRSRWLDDVPRSAHATCAVDAELVSFDLPRHTA